MAKTQEPPKIEHRGSLMTFEQEGRTFHLGYMMDFRERGIYEPNLGRVDVTKAEADIHNSLLSEGEIKGLDECPVGVGRSFYLSKDKKSIRTWAGGDLGGTLEINGQVATLRRKGMVFRGRLKRHNESIYFKRIS